MKEMYEHYLEDRIWSNELKLINYKQPQKTSNMTKVTIIGEHASTVKKYTKIKFIKVLTSSYEVAKAGSEWSGPDSWNNIELICRGYADGMDLMFCYDDADCREDGVLYIGYFNEGLV